MSRPRVRPEFVRPLLGDPAIFFAALARALAHADGTCRGQTFTGGAIMRIRSGRRRIWSPALHLYAEHDEHGSPVLHGRFSPSSPVWTGFVAIYLALACVAMAAVCYGCVQAMLGSTPWAFLGVPAAMAAAGFTYGAAFIGQGLGADDMYELRSFVDRIADLCAEPGPKPADAAAPDNSGDVAARAPLLPPRP